MKLYIMGPEDGGNGVYGIVTEYGEGLASHLCSHRGYAKADLEARRPERQKEWKERFGEYQVLFIGEDDMTREKIKELNEKWYAEYKNKEEASGAKKE